MTTLAQPPVSFHSARTSSVLDADMEQHDEVGDNLDRLNQQNPHFVAESSSSLPRSNLEPQITTQDSDMNGGEGTAGISPSPWEDYQIQPISEILPRDPPVATAAHAVADRPVPANLPSEARFPAPSEATFPQTPDNVPTVTTTGPYSLPPFPPLPTSVGPPPPPIPPFHQDGSSAESSRPLGHDGQSEGAESGDDDDEDNEDEDEERHVSYDRARSFYPFHEDTSSPDDDELRILKSYGECSALDDRHWEERTFFDPQDPEMVPGESGKIEWTIEAFNGTKENQRKDLLVRSPVVSIGGFDWRVKLLPHGNMHTDRLSIYVENVSVQSLPLEAWSRERLPLPSIGDAPLMKRKTVAAQISVILYNPDEPRVHEFKADAHQFHQGSSDHGWSRFTSSAWYEIHRRNYAQRQPLLRNDRLAVKAFIRLMHEPTACLWARHEDGKSQDSIALTGLLPLPPFEDLAFGSVVTLWLHFQPMREMLYLLGAHDLLHHSTTKALDCNPICMLQSVLHRMRARKAATPWPDASAQVSDYIEYIYDTGSEDHDAVQATSALLSQIREQLVKLSSADTCLASAARAALEQLANVFGSAELDFSGARKTRLSIKDKKDMQDAINSAPDIPGRPQLLTLDLERRVFDQEKRVWNKHLNKVGLNDHIICNGSGYTLYGFVAHSGYLQNGKYSSFFRPGGIGGLWYSYKAGHVECQTWTKAVAPREGSISTQTQEEPLALNDRSSNYGDFSGLHRGEESVAYVILYARDDIATTALNLGSEESWDVPQWITNAYDSHVDAQDGTFEDSVPHEMAAEAPSSAPASTMNAVTEETLPYDDGDWVNNDADWVHRGGRSENPDVDTEMDDADGNHDRAVRRPNGNASSTNGYTHGNESRHVLINYLSQPFYEGQMKDGRYYGEGHLIYLCGDEYTGQFEMNQREGQGTMTYQNGDMYTGSWHKGQHHGQGTYTEKRTGNVYKGNWEDGKKHGEGTTTWRVSEEESRLCRICYCSEADAAFYDCGHVVACSACARRVEDCPVCRRRVRDVVKLYYTA
ncbi:hypothetical protein MBLNU459_g5397t2 [Dothideomycetes sp. NU459]